MAARIETGRPMTDTLNNSIAACDNSFDRALDQGLSNRLTLIVGPDAPECKQALDGWLDSLRHTFLRIPCPSGDERDQCPRKIVESFASAGIIEPVEEDTASEESCLASFVRLMNGLAAFPGELVVVLQDYQPCERADRILSFMLEHLPNQIHLYLVSEDVPGLNCIPRLRVRRQLQMIDASSG